MFAEKLLPLYSVKGDMTMAIQIKLVKSLNGRLQKHKATAASLGLKRIGDITVQPDNAATKGKIALIRYLLEVEEVK